MFEFPLRRRPRGVNFLLGGTFVALALLLGGVAMGVVDLGGFGAPQVRIDAPLDIPSPVGAATAAPG